MEEANWILCAKVSPEEGEKVLLTFKNKAGLHVGEALFKEDTYYYTAETDNGYFEEVYGIPIAWMELPKPYTINN